MEIKEFSNLKTISEIFGIIAKKLPEGKSPGDVKPAVALCRDDSVKEIENTLNKNDYMDAFNMNTLSGLPVFGITGVGAFYHHIPDNGIGLIIYAPHIGISEGNLGYLNREGISQVGKSCGANHAILGKWKEGNFGPYENDPELSQVAQTLAPEKENILSADNPLMELTEVEYKKGLEMIKGMVSAVQKGEEHQYQVLLVAGIHLDDSKGNKFDLREIGLFEKGEYRALE